jgi:hypothetical protein
MVALAGQQLEEAGIETYACMFVKSAPFNFMDKIRSMTTDDQPDIIIRVDDDCFAPPQTWDSLIRHGTHMLNFDNNTMAIAPCISNGLPTVDMFADTFFDQQDRDTYGQMVLANPVLEKWTNDYSNLAPAFEGEAWDYHVYNKLLFENGDDRLGVHPVRFNLDIQRWINTIILQKWEKFMNPPRTRSYFVGPQHFPYYCNTCFAIRRQEYKTIIEDKSLKRDAFEEIPFNLYRRQHNKDIVFLTDAWMMNFYFRSVGNFNVESKLYAEIHRRLMDGPT